MAQVTIEEKLLGIETSRNAIRAKLVELGLAENGAKLDALATIISRMINRGAVSVTVKEGDTYTIPEGWHNGSGTVSGVGGGGNYALQANKATPTKAQQNVVPDSGYYGLSGVTVAAIPETYQDVSSVTAGAADVLTGKVFVMSDGTVKAGAMANNGAVNKTLDATSVSYTIPAGKHSGTGKVSITLEEKSVTPTKSAQTITPTAGKVMSKVTVEAIPDEYITTGDATAAAGDILGGKTAYVDGVKVEGTMADNGAETKVLDATSVSYTIPAGKHTGTGKVSITLEEKSVTPTKSAQNITPASGKVLSKVTVGAIPDEYITTTDATATAGDILAGETAYVGGVKVKGTMSNNGAVSGTVNGITTTEVSVSAGYTSGGKVTFDDTKIVEMLDAI